jgi:hypothetical protein
MDKIKLKDITEISFNSSGWYCVYYLGCIKALFELDKNINKRIKKIYCCSGGSMMAPIFLFNIKPDDVLNEWIKFAEHKHDKQYFLTRMNIEDECKHVFDKYYRDKINLKILNKKMNISVTKVKYDTNFPFMHFENKIIYKFKDVDDLYNRITQSSYLPFILGYTPFIDNHFDGGLVNDNYLEKINNKHCFNIGLCSDWHMQTLNSLPICYAKKDSFNKYMIPTTDIITNMFKDGYHDTLRYFKNK